MRLLLIAFTLACFLAHEVPAESVANYRLTFTRTWSAESHPVNFPSDSHFSGLAGATHNSEVVFWEPSGIATQGLEDIAERGNKAAFANEVAAAIADGTTASYLDFAGMSGSRQTRTIEFPVRESFSLLSIVSMIAPSPDWFVGVSGVDLHESGEWISSLDFELYPWDAGTDSGISYRSANANTDPQTPIELLTTFPFEGTGAVATFEIELLSQTEVNLYGDYNGDGFVDGADYTVWRDNLGQQVALPGEDPSVTPNLVSAEDYDVWRQNFGADWQQPNLILGTGVPEPASIIVFLVGLSIGCVVIRRGR